MKVKEHDVSVIVPTLDRRDSLLRMAESLLTQTRRPDELVVVDAGSDPAVEPALQRCLEGSGIELAYRQGPRGTSVQRNVAIDLAAGEYLVLLDDDVVLEPDFIERLLEPFSDPLVGGVLGTFLGDGRLGRLGAAYHHLFGLSHAAAGDDARAYRSGSFRTLARPSRTVRVPVLSGGRTAYRAVCFDGVRFEQYVPGYALSEDVEVSHRIGRTWSFVQTPHAQLLHDHAPGGRVSRTERIARLVFGRAYFFRHHMPQDRRHTRAYAWSCLGLAGWVLLGGARRGPRGLMAALRGLRRGREMTRHMDAEITSPDAPHAGERAIGGGLG